MMSLFLLSKTRVEFKCCTKKHQGTNLTRNEARRVKHLARFKGNSFYSQYINKLQELKYDFEIQFHDPIKIKFTVQS